MNEEDENAEYTFTPWGCLSFILEEYGVDITGITGKIGVHLVEDFMELMEKCGHVKKGESK